MQNVTSFNYYYFVFLFINLQEDPFRLVIYTSRAQKKEKAVEIVIASRGVV